MISVVIPLYNKSEFIEKTILSALNQSVQPDEIIVVDDGSTDGSAKIAQKFIQNGVRLIRQENQGVSSARNTGVLQSNSSYIAFLDADDEWLPSHLETLLMLITKHPTAVLLSTSHVERVKGRLCHPKSPFKDGWSGIVENFVSAYAKSYAIINSSTACVNRNAFLETGGFPSDVSSGEDIITWLKLSFAGQVACANKITSVYNKRVKALMTGARYDSIPGSLLYVSNLISQADLSNKSIKPLKSLYLKIAVRTCAGAMWAGSLQMWNALMIDSRRTQNYKLLTYLILIRVLFVPMSLKHVLTAFSRKNR